MQSPWDLQQSCNWQRWYFVNGTLLLSKAPLRCEWMQCREVKMHDQTDKQLFEVLVQGCALGKFFSSPWYVVHVDIASFTFFFFLQLQTSGGSCLHISIFFWFYLSSLVYMRSKTENCLTIILHMSYYYYILHCHYTNNGDLCVSE